MSGTKDTPRQKMIGMMYLVLTALLALNVSKDILDAFVVVNQGLENTNNNFSGRNENLYMQFDLAKSVDPVLVTPNWKKAQEIKKQSAELSAYIDKVQKQLVETTEGVLPAIADTLQMTNIENKDNYDSPTDIMIGDSEDGSAGASRELKNKLVNFRTMLNNFILPADKNKVNVEINTDDPVHSEENENWEMYNFYNRPLVASMTILSKLKTDVKNAESLVVDYLLKQVDTEVMKFDTIAAKVIPQSSYVMLGEEYRSDIFIAAFSKTRKPEIMVENASIEVEKGLGKYTAATNKEGIFNYSGTIKMISPKGKEVVFPFKSEYIVAKPALTVSADNMNVVYIGLDNPISVSVPGIPNERLTVSATNGSLRPNGNGKFTMNVKSGIKADVNVYATMENGERRNMGTMSFRVKEIPKPSAKFGNLTQSGKMTKAQIETQMGLMAFYENFDFKAEAKVISFTMSVSIGGVSNDIPAKGNTFTEKMKENIRSLRKGQKLIFEQIIGKGPDGKEKRLNDLVITVM